ncbi:hypothetical protein MHYP_G00186130 [Metynnis hypsauchen]
MQCEFSRLTPEERQRRLSNRLCLYCGSPGHILRTCPTRPHPEESDRSSRGGFYHAQRGYPGRPYEHPASTPGKGVDAVSHG